MRVRVKNRRRDVQSKRLVFVVLFIVFVCHLIGGGFIQRVGFMCSIIRTRISRRTCCHAVVEPIPDDLRLLLQSFEK